MYMNVYNVYISKELKPAQASSIASRRMLHMGGKNENLFSCCDPVFEFRELFLKYDN